MMADFQELETLAEQELDLTLADVLAIRAQQYRDVIPEEIIDLLEEAVATYATLAPTSRHLCSSARKEIKFFLALYRDKIRNFRPRQNYQPQRKIIQLSAYGSSYGTNF